MCYDDYIFSYRKDKEKPQFFFIRNGLIWDTGAYINVRLVGKELCVITSLRDDKTCLLKEKKIVKNWVKHREIKISRV